MTDTPLPTVLVVAVALIDVDGRVLIAKRPQGKSLAGLWEFPGGAVEEGETKKAALKREIKEELGVDIKVGNLLLTLADEIPALKINIFLYECGILRGSPRPVDCEEVRWARLDELNGLDLAPADKKVLAWLKRAR